MNTMPRSIRPAAVLRHGVLVALGLVASACTGGDAGKTAAVTDSSLMREGLDLMYTSGNPVGAEAKFREILTRTPSHYGAHYQLAVALDRGGRPVEARPAWQEVLRLARSVPDSATISTAQTRLAAPDTASQEAMMALGLDLLHRQGNPTAAIAQFRGVLRKNRTHYGATYQLATALEVAGQAAEARVVWQRMLGMATQINDQKVMQTARDRLK